MPANLFYGTGIPACIVVVDKEDAHARKGIFMIDASAGFMKDGPKNRLRAQDIHKIVDVFNKRLEVLKYSRMVSVEEVEQVKAAVPDLIAKWEPVMGVKVERVFVQRMKTKWGSCNAGTRSIRLNTDLAKKPPQCLEYIVVHELVHLLERHHNDRFTALMDAHLSHWRQFRKLLNTAPLGHESWSY